MKTSTALRLLASGFALAAVLGARAQAPAAEASSPTQGNSGSFSEAENLLFTRPYLEPLSPPRSLRYAYVRDDGAQGRHTDSATLRLTRASDGKCCKVQASYLSGADEIRLPEIDDARSNPVLLFFLEHEVRALQRITKGQASHFRKRIRQALVDNAKVTSTTIRWNGQELPAREIRISPYLDDPFRARFEKQATKVYVFVVSDAVPGGIYRMAAELPGADESLTLEDRQDGK